MFGGYIFWNRALFRGWADGIRLQSSVWHEIKNATLSQCCFAC